MQTKRYSGVLVKCKDKVLLCKRNHSGSFPGMWSIPAGKVEKLEDYSEAAKREFYEETNINIEEQNIKLISVMPRYTRDGKNVKGMMCVFLLEVKKEIYPDLENATDGFEHTECSYFKLEEISEEMCGKQLYRVIKNIFGVNFV